MSDAAGGVLGRNYEVVDLCWICGTAIFNYVGLGSECAYPLGQRYLNYVGLGIRMWAQLSFGGGKVITNL